MANKEKRRSIKDVDNDLAEIKSMLAEAINSNRDYMEPKEPEKSAAQLEHEREFGERYKVIEGGKADEVDPDAGKLPTFNIREDIAAWVRDIAKNRRETERPGWTVENELALIVKHSFHASKHAFEAEQSGKRTVTGEKV